MFADILSRLTDQELTELNPPGKGKYECGYDTFEPLPDILAASSTHTPISTIGISNYNATNGNIVQN